MKIFFTYSVQQYHIKGHCVAQLSLIMQVVPLKGSSQNCISGVFLTYVQHFDIIPQITPPEQDLSQSLLAHCLSSNER